MYPSELCAQLAAIFVDNFKRMGLEGNGPGGYRQPSFIRPKTRGYTMGRGDDPGGIILLNETMERAERPVLRADAAAVYVHVDDIVLGKAGKCTKAASDLIHK
eukprot:14126018-Alexandrium_andersonii.AAC.1